MQYCTNSVKLFGINLKGTTILKETDLQFFGLDDKKNEFIPITYMRELKDSKKFEVIIEGESILKSFPFDEYSFRVLTVKHNKFPVREHIKGFLENLGYTRVREFEIDNCYIKDVNSQWPAWRSRVWTHL